MLELRGAPACKAGRTDRVGKFIIRVPLSHPSNPPTKAAQSLMPLGPSGKDKQTTI
jgi:hypothetical protein